MKHERKRNTVKGIFKMTRRLIRKTPGRFISLFAIVMLGTAFFVGVSAISMAMSTSVNRYDDMLNLKDITIYSNYGFDQDDVDAVGALESVVTAEGASFVDVYSGYGDSSAITRVHSYDPDAEINHFVLRSGRLPERNDEVLADNGTILMPGYKLGTVLSLTRPDNDLDETLSVDHVTVVGTIDTPLYLNETREASTLSNLYIQTFLYIPKEAFVTDYYTEMNVLIRDGKTYDEFSDEYRDYSASVKEEIKGFAAAGQKDARRNKIYKEAMDDYNSGLAEYEDGLAEYNQAIADAEKEIRNAEDELSSGWEEVRKGQQTLTDAQNELNQAAADYGAQIAEGQRKLQEGYRELEQGKEEFEKQEEEYLKLRKELSDALEQLNQPVVSETMTLNEALDHIPEEYRGRAETALAAAGIDPANTTAREALDLLKQHVTPDTVREMNRMIDDAMNADPVTTMEVIEDGEVPFDPAIVPEPDPSPEEPPAEGTGNTALQGDPEPGNGSADMTEGTGNTEPQGDPEPGNDGADVTEDTENPDPDVNAVPGEEPVNTDGENDDSSVQEEDMPQPDLPETDTAPETPVPQGYYTAEEIEPVLLGNISRQAVRIPSVHIVARDNDVPETLGDLAGVLGEDSEAFSFLSDLLADPQTGVSEGVRVLNENAELILVAEDYLEKAMTEPLPDSVTIGELALVSEDVERLKTELNLTDESTVGDLRNALRENIRRIDSGLAEGRAAIAEGEAELQKGEAELAQAMEELNRKLAEGQAEIDEGWNTITESIGKLTDGRKTLNASILEFEEKKAEGKAELDDAAAELEDGLKKINEMEEAEWTVLDRSQHYSSETYRGTINQMAAIARIFPLFFIAVAALVCLTTMTRLVNEERGQIGILRALGYSPAKCSFVYLFYAAAAGILGCAAGTAAGLATFPIIIYNTWKMLYILPKMQMEIPWRLILTASFAFVLMMTGVTEYVLYGDMKEMPSVIMRPKAPKVGKDILLEKVTVIWNRISFSWKVTIRNLARYKRRMAMTVLGVGGCTALLVTGFGISDSINNIVNIQFNELSNFDARIHLESGADLSAVEKQLLSIEHADSVYPVAEYSGMVSMDGEKEEVATVEIFRDSETLGNVYNLRERVGHKPLSTERGSVIISEKMAENLSISEGDEILLESSDGEKVRVPVNGITEMYVYHYVMMTEDTYRSLFNTVPETNTLLLRLEDGVEADETIKSSAASVEGVESVDFTDFVIRNFETMIQGIDGVVIVLVAASMGLAFVVLGNLTNVNISERMREIATLKVLGFRRREVQNYIYHENNIMVILGALIGLPAGRALSGYIMKEVELTNVMFGRGVEPLTYVYAFALTVAFGLVVNFVMRRKLNSVMMVESLKSVE